MTGDESAKDCVKNDSKYFVPSSYVKFAAEANQRHDRPKNTAGQA